MVSITQFLSVQKELRGLLVQIMRSAGKKKKNVFDYLPCNSFSRLKPGTWFQEVILHVIYGCDVIFSESDPIKVSSLPLKCTLYDLFNSYKVYGIIKTISTTWCLRYIDKQYFNFRGRFYLRPIV